MRSPSARAPSRRQSGLTLLVTLIMLIMVTLIVVMSYNLGQSNLKIVGNAQDRQRAVTIAEAALNGQINAMVTEAGTISHCDFSGLLTNLPKPIVDGVAVTISGSVLSETCRDNSSFRTSWNTSREAMQKACGTDPASAACAAAKKADDDNRRNFLECARKVAPGVQNPPSNSYCANVNMELRATGVDKVSGAAATVTRGVNLLCAIQDLPNSTC